MVGQGVFEKLRVIAFGVVGPLMRPSAFRSGKRAMSNSLSHVDHEVEFEGRCELGVEREAAVIQLNVRESTA